MMCATPGGVKRRHLHLVVTAALFFIRRLLHCHGGCEFRFRTEFGAVEVEEDRDGD